MLTPLRDRLPTDHPLRALSATDPFVSVAESLSRGSSFAADLIVRHPEAWMEQRFDQPLRERLWAILHHAKSGFIDQTNLDGLLRHLRQTKHRVILAIVQADLEGGAPVAEVTGALSLWAGWAIDQAWRWLVEHHAAAQGCLVEDMAILGMGKLGSRELNFSSDVDLIFVAPDPYAETTGGARSLDAQRYLQRLARQLIEAIGQTTADGMIFRVDMRLRPGGETAPLIPDGEMFLNHYFSYADTWERAAMIKARPIAGNRSFARGLLRQLSSFCFPRSIDFTLVEGIMAMKEKINQYREHEEGFNVKLGHGGIREIEFFAQAHQLLLGGKDRRLRIRPTERVLFHLSQRGILSVGEKNRLIDAYRFLRRVEHRLQAWEEQQTHRLPDDPKIQLRIARMLLPPATRHVLGDEELLELFHGRLQEVRRVVSEAFQGMLRSDSGSTPERSDNLPPWSSVAQLHWQRPDDAERLYRSLHDLLDHLPWATTERLRARRVVTAVAQTVTSSPMRDAGLILLHRFIESIAPFGSVVALLDHHPELIRRLGRLMTEASTIARTVVTHPPLLEAVYDPNALARFPETRELKDELDNALRSLESPDEAARVLARFRGDMTLRIAVRDLVGLSDADEVSAALSALAEASIQAIHRWSITRMQARHGDLPGATFAIIALGKLGSRELGYNSDLDVMFLYDVPEDCWGSSGERSLDPSTWTQRWAREIMGILGAMTPLGPLFEVDARLRPGGDSGPLATTLQALRHYEFEEAWTWEHQALCRARMVAGDSELGAAFRILADELLTTSRHRRTLAAEIRLMREKIATEKGADLHDIKLAPGGLVDLEFLAQYLILGWSGEHPRLLKRGTVAALLAAPASGQIPTAEAIGLVEGWHWMHRLDQKLALLDPESKHRIPSSGPLLEALAQIMAVTPTELLDTWEHYRDHAHQWLNTLLPLPKQDTGLGIGRRHFRG